ncbi:MAG: GNAT family N-acetyltransferase [Alphaproteobacteria bacterium]|nr:GNAT family N-acetyltransferase [Alphaproteobacteria bacterium]
MSKFLNADDKQAPATQDYATRPAQESDREGLAALMRKNYFKSDTVEPWQEEMVQKRIDDFVSPGGAESEGGRMFVAISGDAPVAFTSIVPDPKRGGLLVDDLYTRPDHERRGIAGKLLGECESFAREQGESAVHLSVDEQKPGVRAYYEKRGWVAQSFKTADGAKTDIDPANPRVSTWLLVKPLADTGPKQQQAPAAPKASSQGPNPG